MIFNLNKKVSNTKKTIRKTINKITYNKTLNHRRTKKGKKINKKYSTRPSPNKSATLYKIGTVKKGNDGLNYVVVSFKRKTN